MNSINNKKLRGFFVPVTLFDNPKYKDLSSDAKLLYGIYNRRQQLSQINQEQWQDKKGNVFFIFTNHEAEHYLGWSKGKVVKTKKELINYDLLSNKKTMSADHLYLLVPKIRKQDYYAPNDFSAKYQNGSFIPKKLRGFFIPTTLFDNPKYNNLSSDAKLLYGIYNRRQQLSQINQEQWQDKKGNVFFIFTNHEAEHYLGWSKGKVVKTKKELINYELLIAKKTMSADHLYLLMPEASEQDYYVPKDSAQPSKTDETPKSQQQNKAPNESSNKYQSPKFIPKKDYSLINKETKYINTNKDTNKSDTYIQTKNQTSTQIKPETLELDKQIFADTQIDILKILAGDDETTYKNLKQVILLAKKKALNFGHVKSSLFNFVDKDVKLPFYQCLLTILKKFKQNKIRNLSKYLYVSVRNLFEQIGNKRAQNFYNNTGKSIMWDSENYFGKDTVYIPAINKSLDNLFDCQASSFAVSTTPD